MKPWVKHSVDVFPSLVVNTVPQSKIILLQFFSPTPLFYSFKGKKTYAMSLSGPRGLVCQVHSNVADSNYDMIWQVCGHNQIENEEYFHWRAKFRESWAPKPHGNPHRWLTSRHESQKTMLWKVLQSRLNSFSLRVCAEKALAVQIFFSTSFWEVLLWTGSSPLHQVGGAASSSQKGFCTSWMVVLYITHP